MHRRLITAVVPALVLLVATVLSLVRRGLGHYGITVRPRDLVREEFYITSGSRVVIILRLLRGVVQATSYSGS